MYPEKTVIQKDTYPNVHFSTIYDSQDKSNLNVHQERNGYEDVVEYYSAMKKNKIMSIAATWMDLKIVIQNEVRQRKTNTI